MARSPVHVKVQMKPSEVRRVANTLKKLPENLQRKVLTQASDRTMKKTVLPLVVSRIGTRSFEPPNWRYPAGQGLPRKSHDKGPGILRKMMAKNVTKRVRPMKRSRIQVGRFLITPTREELGIPDKSEYKGYYPAFLEFQKSPIGNAPQPFMRGTFRKHKSQIVRDFSSQIRNRTHLLKAKGKI